MIVCDGHVFLTPQEASVRFIIPLPTLYNWCRRGFVEVFSPVELGVESSSKYLIEEESLKARRALVYEEA